MSEDTLLQSSALAGDVDQEQAKRQQRYDQWVAIITTFVLAVATLSAAWSGYQSALWGGIQATSYTQAGARRAESLRASNEASSTTNLDVFLFGQFVNAYAADSEDLANFYEERFREEFRPAFEAWLATDPLNNPDAPSSPFAMPEYRLAATERATQLVAEAEASFAAGQEANRNSDNYVLNTVVLASVLFLSGIESRFTWLPGRIAITVLAIVMLALGLYNVLTYPIAS